MLPRHSAVGMRLSLPRLGLCPSRRPRLEAGCRQEAGRYRSSSLAAVFVRRVVAGKRSRAPGTVSSASPSRPGAGHGLACTGVYFALGPLFGGWPWIGQPPFLNFLCFYLTHFFY